MTTDYLEKSHLAQGIAHAAIQQGHKVLYREAHVLLEELAEASLDGTRRERFTELATVPLLVIDDLATLIEVLLGDLDIQTPISNALGAVVP